MHEIVCRSTEGLLLTGNLDSRLQEGQGARDCDRRMQMFGQDPRESRSKARTGTGAHNHGTAGIRPCGPPRRTGRPNLENKMKILLQMCPARPSRSTLRPFFGGNPLAGSRLERRVCAGHLSSPSTTECRRHDPPLRCEPSTLVPIFCPAWRCPPCAAVHDCAPSVAATLHLGMTEPTHLQQRSCPQACVRG